MPKQYDDDDDTLHLDDLTSDDFSENDQTGARPAKRKNFFARHKVLTAFLALIGLMVAGVAGFALYVNSKLSDVDTYVTKIDDSNRVPKATPEGQSGPSAINILLLGADKTSGKSISELVAADTWDPGAMRSDAVMLVHIPADRSHVYLMSFPRDSFVDIPGQGKDKINAAFSYGGPDLAMQTVEQYSQVHIDHVMMIDWNGFKDLTDALGGVTLHEPGVGNVTMNGEQALEYVRTRKSLPNGDFDRVKRQQNFLRQLMAQTVDNISVTDPAMLVNIISAIADNTTVDSGLTPSVMRDLAWEMRSIKTNNVSFMTAPTLGTGMEGSASVVYLDDAACKELFTAVNQGLMPQYMNSHKVDSLPAPSNVN